MLKSNLKQKRNPLPMQIAIITAVSYSVVYSLIKYFHQGQFNLAESLLGALIFFVVFFFLWSYLNKRIEKKQKREKRNYGQK